jgi:membrane protein DedA with SNARE-associated domain
LAALLWAGTWVGVGYVLQDSMKDVTTAAASLAVWVIVEIVAVVGAYGAP